ncbi:MAG: pitrilysin family protein [candidate division Zixibacteria bacterium]
MKKLFICCIAVLILGAPIAAKINLPDAKSIKLDNGLQILVVERHGLPLFSLDFGFRCGSIHDPDSKFGLANLCNEMLMRGTPTRTAKELAEEISFRGGSLSNYCGREMSGFSGEFLSKYGESAIEILADIVLNSSFTEDEFTKTKTRIIANLQSRLENASRMATEHIFNSILGENPFSHIPSGNPESISSINREAALDFYENAYTPDNCLLVICGDISADMVTQWCQTYFGNWKGKRNLPNVKADFQKTEGVEIILYDKEDASQTQIRFGANGPGMSAPDRIPFEAARTIFAGSFTSRLVDEIRVKRGLTYGVSMRSSKFSGDGVLYVSTFTKNVSVGEVLDIILNETQKIHTIPLTDEELTGTIKYRNGLYPLSFETNEGISDKFLNLWFYNLDKSFYEDYQESFKKLTSETLMKAAKDNFPLMHYKLVLVGKAEEVLSQLEKYGKVEVIPFYQ